ncbi:MAG TPA: hypothetical protein VE175_09445 [Woeseiaceae bacterium]|nr:hypothetical protein [Woeseiaceae bacterium]
MILASLYFVFPRYIKEPLTRWLIDDDEQSLEKPESEAHSE